MTSYVECIHVCRPFIAIVVNKRKVELDDYVKSCTHFAHVAHVAQNELNVLQSTSIADYFWCFYFYFLCFTYFVFSAAVLW